jgi:hypothetical protein
MSKRLAFTTVLTAAVVAAPILAAHAEMGRFIKGSGATIYAATSKQRRGIINPACYVAAGGRPDFSDTKVVPDAELAAIPEGAPIVCEKAFVKFANDPTVYMVQGGLLRPFPDPPCAFKHGVATNWSNIVTLDPKWGTSYGYGASACPIP